MIAAPSLIEGGSMNGAGRAAEWTWDPAAALSNVGGQLRPLARWAPVRLCSAAVTYISSSDRLMSVRPPSL